MTIPDTDGRLYGMIQTVAGYAQKSGKLSAEQFESMLAAIRQAMDDGTYLAISPQFLVTAVA